MSSRRRLKLARAFATFGDWKQAASYAGYRLDHYYIHELLDGLRPEIYPHVEELAGNLPGLVNDLMAIADCDRRDARGPDGRYKFIHEMSRGVRISIREVELDPLQGYRPVKIKWLSRATAVNLLAKAKNLYNQQQRQLQPFVVHLSAQDLAL